MKMTILIVDDEPIVRKGMTAIIEKYNQNWKVIGQEADGTGALSFMNTQLPDVLITDVRMSVMDGIRLSQNVRRKWPDLIIIVVSGYGEFEYAKEAVRFGALDYLLKPTSPSSLIKVLTKAEDIVRRQKEARLEKVLRSSASEPEKVTTVLTKTEKYNHLIEDAVAYMGHHYSEDLSTGEMAEILHLNTNYFCDLFKRETGMTFLDYLTKLRINMAKTILREKISVKTYEVAEMVGYSDSRYFTRVFKRETGMTPSEYRG